MVLNRKYNIGDLVVQRGIRTENPVFGIVVGWDEKLDLVIVRWNQPIGWESHVCEEDLVHPEMLEIVQRPKKD